MVKLNRGRVDVRLLSVVLGMRAIEAGAAGRRQDLERPLGHCGRLRRGLLVPAHMVHVVPKKSTVTLLRNARSFILFTVNVLLYELNK